MPIRVEDVNEAAAYDLRAAHIETEDPEGASSLRWLANMLRAPTTHWPTIDCERSSEDEYHDVCDELGDLHAYDARDDSFVRFPVRVAMQGDPQIEIGPYDLRRKDISVLRRAIASYDRLKASIIYGPPLTREQLADLEAQADEPDHDPDQDDAVVDLDSRRDG
ncbi:MAG: hypothetical protein JWR34_3407 [Mycobacterium sp.]|nr:hypothetical protein [Mycobacterium sp.]